MSEERKKVVRPKSAPSMRAPVRRHRGGGRGAKTKRGGGLKKNTTRDKKGHLSFPFVKSGPKFVFAILTRGGAREKSKKRKMVSDLSQETY